MGNLKNKVAENYQSPDIILAIQETKYGMLAKLMEYSGYCQVLVLVKKNIYTIPSYTDESVISLYLKNADEYFKHFRNLISCIRGIEGRLYTLSECNRYDDYFVVKIPGEFERQEVSMENEKIKQFVEDFKKKYSKNTELDK